MEPGLLNKLSGTLVNALTVLLGTGLGLALKGRLPERMGRIMVQGVGLTTLFIGFGMASALNRTKGGAVDGVVLGLLALVLGGLLGEWLGVEEGLEALGERLKRAFRGGGGFTEGFVAASLLFCVGPMTLLGSIQNGLTGDASLLVLKATLDGLSSIALASTFGLGVGFSVLVILLYQGGVALLAGTLAQALPDPAQDPRVLLVTGVGGLMVLGVGINLLGLTKVRVAAFLPALFLAPLLWALADWVS
ncbi:DUF554 domain-containing protein [Thermus filiformis]|uniref:DUF554 domain-containing protein n=1 Tax=Thermus filiformis TaxID=276 RepID=A0A0A2WSM6_THEFI|nr:DUF554 domain-containing protein [Thermus filiformis]KGQ21305.1 hypothetical protein THFILI_07025 [Thermus filiformis]